MKRFFLPAFILLASLPLHSQFVYDYVKAADNYFMKGDYASAAEYYEKFFNDKLAGSGSYQPYSPQRSSKKTVTDAGSKEQARYRLAESYRLLNYPSKAIPHYEAVINSSLATYPLARFHYASQQRALADYAKAEQQFKIFLDEYRGTDEYRNKAERELANLRFIQEQLNRRDLKYFTVSKSSYPVNTEGANYAAAWLGENTMLFTSTRPLDSAAKNKVYTNRIYQVNRDGANWGSIEKTLIPEDKDMHQGIVTVTPDGNSMFLTRWHTDAAKKQGAIYVSNRNGNNWESPRKLGENINAPGSNNQQPHVTEDGKYLLFSSDRAGGQGGYDIWYAPLENGTPGTPVNLGTTINTAQDEQAPSYHAASATLVFSSNGRTGMGGYDLFHSKGTMGNWSEPMNFGYPVNSVRDDLYLLSRGTAKNVLENVMLSSDRDAACCLEMFYLSKVRPLRQLNGRLVSCNPAKPLTGARVQVIDTVQNRVLFTEEVGADGRYGFAMEDYLHVKIKAEAPGFIPGSLHAGVPADMEQESFEYPELCLLPEPPKVNEKFVIENIFYDFDKAELRPESFPALDEVVRMLNFYPNMEIELGAHTDSKGSDAYNLKLSEARARSVVAYLVNKGIDPSRLQAKGYGESMPIADNTIDGKDNPEGRQKNRRTEFKVLKTD